MRHFDFERISYFDEGAGLLPRTSAEVLPLIFAAARAGDGRTRPIPRARHYFSFCRRFYLLLFTTSHILRRLPSTLRRHHTLY